LVAYSDYLCPWCFNASLRLRRLQEEDPGVVISWKSFLLRPQSKQRDLERFRRYTESWSRPGAESDAGRFQPWRGSASPPASSLPPQVAAKAAAHHGGAAFARFHERLFEAYFGESRDISDRGTLRDLWREAGLPDSGFAEVDASDLRQRVLAEDREARDLGATGVPAIRLADADVVVTGALPLDTYRRWVERTRARRAEEAGGRPG